MNNNLNRILIETTVRQTIKQMQEDPERSTRNLIDMALIFSEGRFQRHFLELAQKILKNEHSSYYRIIPDIVSSIDTERIITFGMNVGYNSCTYGAQIIRSIEEKEFFNIPWSVSLEIDAANYSNNAAYISLLEQGKALGIYTWIIIAPNGIVPVMKLAEYFPDCAFAIFCSPDDITSAFLDEVENINNVMYVLEYKDGVENACHLLRSRKFIYSVYYPYLEKHVGQIMNGDILSDTEILHPVFTIFTASPFCPSDVRTEVYQYIQRTRLDLNYKTIPFDMIYDNHFIDGIISDQACSISFNTKGKCYSNVSKFTEEEYTFFDYPLDEILRKICPKKHVLE